MDRNQRGVDEEEGGGSQIMDTDDVDQPVSAAPKIRKRQKVDDDMKIVESEEVQTSVFNRPGLLLDSAWNPKTAEASAFFALQDFGVLDARNESSTALKQTIVILLSIPSGARQWAVNLCPTEHLDNHNIFMHFNMRYAAGKQMRKELALNDKEGTWGPVHKEGFESNTRMQGLLASTIELVIQIRQEGFVIFANNRFVAMFFHRRELPRDGRLVLSFPITDDMNKLQEGVVRKVWWGNLPHDMFEVPPEALLTDSMVKQRDHVRDLSSRPCRMRTIAVTGLPMRTSPVELQFIEEGLKGVFGVKDIVPEAINVVPGKGVAYVRLASKEQQVMALKSLQRYKIEDTEGKKFTLKLDSAF